MDWQWTWTQVAMAAGAGGLTLFIWNAIVWMGLQHHNSDFRRLPNAGAAEGPLTGLAPGMYMLPHYEDFAGGFKDPALDPRMRKGPNALVVVQPPGPCMQGSTFVKGFLLDVFVAFGIALGFKYSGDTLYDWKHAVAIPAVLGATLAGSPGVANAIWMKYPWSHAIKLMFDAVVGFALVGLVFHWLRTM
jgi:hypothetical protein